MDYTNSTERIQTGFSRLDEFTGGLQPGHLTVLTTYTNMDKTTLEPYITQILALNIAKNMENIQNRPIALFDFDREWSNIRRFEESLTFLYPPYRNEIQRLCDEARHLKGKHDKLSLVVVDGLQYILNGSNYDNRDLTLHEVSKSLNALATELNIPVIACAPLDTHLDSKAFDMIKINASLIVSLNEKSLLNEDKKTFVLLHVNKTIRGYPGLMHLYYNKEHLRFINK